MDGKLNKYPEKIESVNILLCMPTMWTNRDNLSNPVFGDLNYFLYCHCLKQSINYTGTNYRN